MPVRTTPVRDWLGCVPMRLGAPSIIVAALAALFPATMRAQGPREFLNIPVNQVTGFLDFIGSKAETAASSDLPLPNNTSITRLGTAFILWSLPQRNRYGGVSVSVPYGTVNVEGLAGKVEESGFADPAIAFHANIFGLPALRPDQFADAIPRPVFASLHLTVNAPLGAYDRNSPVNTGAHRWAFTPLANLNMTPDEGVSWIEFYASGKFFTDNNEFQGANRLSQHPLLTLVGHYSHNIGKQMWASIGAYYNYGGETFVNDVPQDDVANTWRPTVFVSRRFGEVGVTLRYEMTASTPDGAPTNALFGIRVATVLF